MSFMISILLIAGAFGLAAAARAQTPREEEGPLEIENGLLKVSFNPGTGRFAVTEQATGRTFVKDGRFRNEPGTAELVDLEDGTFGMSQAIAVSYPDGNPDWIVLFPGLPFALFRSARINLSRKLTLIKAIGLLHVGLDLGRDPDQLRAFGTAGLTHPAEHPGSYAYLSIVDPATRNGVVAGWLTHDRGSGVVFSRVEEGQVWMDAQVDYGRLRVGPGQFMQTEVFALGYFADARLGLEAYADAIARIYAIHLPPQPAGYCTWYSDQHGGASDEKHLAELADFAAKHLKPFGFSFVQIDDLWQEGERRNGPAKNFTTHKPNGPYPGGMKAAADHVQAQGLTPGIWFMPFTGDHEDPFFQPHLDWFAHRPDGSPFVSDWGGTSLDLTHPEVQEYVRSVAERLAHDWGYRYFKMDGLYTGTATKQVYVNDGYRGDDELGEAVVRNPDQTPLEAFRDGLKLVREAAGKDVFFLGCCAPQNMRSFGGSFGLVDAMRIGPDNGADWDGLLRGIVHGSRTYFLHGRVWYNDPDPVYVRASMPLEHARLICSWVAISGQLTVNSDWLPDLPPERRDLLKRILPSHGLLPRPVDLFENDPPRLWRLTDERRPPRRDVLALFNWNSDPLGFDVPLDRIGLLGDTSYVAFDYWENTLRPPFRERLQGSLPPQSCCILAVRPVLERPQLISTSRHLTQGMVDVLEETWDEAGKVLSGRSQVVGGDPYELRIVIPPPDRGWRAASAEVSAADRAAGVEITWEEADGLVRARIVSPTGREVTWAVRFSMERNKP